jgi:hypothetical protein
MSLCIVEDVLRMMWSDLPAVGSTWKVTVATALKFTTLLALTFNVRMLDISNSTEDPPTDAC